MKYEIGDRVIAEQWFMGEPYDLVFTIDYIDGLEYSMKESWWWYGEDEIKGLEEDFIINDRFEILDL